MKLFVAAGLPAKAQVSRASAGGKFCQGEAREKKRYAAGQAAGFAARVLELRKG